MARRPISKARPWTPTRGAFKGRTFTTERQYRNALARRKGFRSWAEQQRAPRRVTHSDQLRRLHPQELEARRDAFKALSLMRREGLSLRQAAREAHTTPATVRRHAGSALDLEHGRYVAKRSDRLLRVVDVLGVGGIIYGVELRSSRQASLVGRHWAAVWRYLHTGFDDELRPLEGKSVAGIDLETDLDAIDEWERRGELEIEDIYSLIT